MNIILSLDIMCVNKVAFVITISRNSRLIKTEFVQNSRQEKILDKMKMITSIYLHRGFRITDCNSYNNFEPLQEVLTSLNIGLKTVGRGKTYFKWSNVSVPSSR